MLKVFKGYRIKSPSLWTGLRGYAELNGKKPSLEYLDVAYLGDRLKYQFGIKFVLAMV